MAKETPKLKEFYQSIKNAAELISEHAEKGNFINVISHIDADGLAAAGIMGKALVRMEALFSIRTWKQVEGVLIEELSSKEKTLNVFTDLGSGSLDLLKTKLSGVDTIILDHHQPIYVTFPKLTHVNPHLYVIDGARDISGAGIAYLTAKEMDKLNIDLSAMAIVGALGDLQDKNQKRELINLNSRIVQDALDARYISAETDLILYGRETRPVHKALAYTMNPYIQGLSGEEDKCLGFLTNIGINLKNKDQWKAISDLNVEEKQKIFSEIAKFLLFNRATNNITSLIGTVYTLVKEERGTPLRDAREFSSLLNACGRMSKSGLGVAICIGCRAKILDESLNVLSNYRRTLSEYMNWLMKTPDSIDELGNIYVIKGKDVIDELMLSAIASILAASSYFKENKPILAYTSAKDGMIKVSGRLPTNVVNKKINLGTIFRDVSIQLKGRGGGHDVAAGAQIPQGVENDFIRLVDQLISIP